VLASQSLLQFAKPLLRYGDLIFLQWRPSAKYKDHPQKIFGDLYCPTKSGWNWCNSIDNTRFNILQVWLENAYSRPLCDGFWAVWTQMESDINETPRRDILQKHVIWCVDLTVANSVSVQTTHVVRSKSNLVCGGSPKCQFSQILVKQFWRCGGRNLSSPTALAIGLYM